MNGITIRPAAAGDEAAIVALVRELNLFEDAISGDRTSDAASARLRYQDHLATLRRDPTAALLVACDGEDAVVGYLFFQVETRPVFVRPALRRVGYISELCVARQSRGAGIGRELITAAETLARRQGVGHLGLTVLEGNDGAHAAYDRAGFRDYAREMLKPLEEARNEKDPADGGVS